MEQELEQARKEREIQGSKNRYTANPWLEFTGWVEHLQKFTRENLLKTIQPVRSEMLREEEIAVGE